MEHVEEYLRPGRGRKPRAGIFLSGSGTNAENLLRRWQEAGEAAPFEPAVLVTDAPRTSRAFELGRLFGLPVAASDIRAFYREHGVRRISLATPEGRELREAWTAGLREQLAPYDLDFGVLAGFVPLTNLVADLPRLNVHPGDLTYCKDGRRYLVGLHTVPVERALLEGLEFLRSSVILALPYTGGGEDMDAGPILGISEEVPVDLQGHSREELADCLAARPEKRPKGGFGDVLEAVARHNLERLKVAGDWVVLPGVVFDFARGRFARGADGGLYYGPPGRRHPVDTVIYGAGGEREILFRDSGKE